MCTYGETILALFKAISVVCSELTVQSINAMHQTSKRIRYYYVELASTAAHIEYYERGTPYSSQVSFALDFLMYCSNFIHKRMFLPITSWDDLRY